MLHRAGYIAFLKSGHINKYNVTAIQYLTLDSASLQMI